MRVVTATIIMKGSYSADNRTLYSTMSVDAYRKLVAATGAQRLENSQGLPIMINMDEVAAISCGPERDE